MLNPAEKIRGRPPGSSNLPFTNAPSEQSDNNVESQDSKIVEQENFVLLTAEQVMERLNISRPTLHNRTNAGHFHVIKKGNRAFYHPDEVAKEEQRAIESHRLKPGRRPSIFLPTTPPVVPKKPRSSRSEKSETTSVYLTNAPQYEGQIASEAFRLFKEGKDVRDAVIELKQTVELVEHLYSKWKKHGPVGEWYLASKQFNYLRERFAWNEDPPTPEGLVKMISIFIQKEAERLVRIRSNEMNPGEKLTIEERKALNELESEKELPTTNALTESEKKALAELESESPP